MAITIAKLNGVAIASVAKRNGIALSALAKINGLDNTAAAASVAFDAVGPSSAGAGSANPSSPVTWSHTCGGSNRVLFVGVAVGPNSPVDADFVITGITYNSVAMTLVPSSLVHSNASNWGYCVLYYLIAPATGANTVSLAFTNATPESLDAVECGSISFTGVNQTTPFTNLASATGDGNRPAVTVTSTTSSMVLDVVANGSGITSSGKTLRWKKENNTRSAGGNGAQSTAAGAASVAMSYTVTSDYWAIVGLSVNP